VPLKPLEGIRVLDLSVLPPGGYCTVQLADLGAEVVRVESPALAGKPSLVIGEVGLSRGKRSLTLDQRHERANDVLRRLVLASDVLVENMAPGRMQARGRASLQPPDVRPALAAALFDTMAQAIPWRVLRPFPLLLSRRLCGAAAAADLGMDGRVSFASRALFALLMACCAASMRWAGCSRPASRCRASSPACSATTC